MSHKYGASMSIPSMKYSFNKQSVPYALPGFIFFTANNISEYVMSLFNSEKSHSGESKSCSLQKFSASSFVDVKISFSKLEKYS